MQSLLQLTDTQISTWVASFMLPLFRVASMLMVMPIFGTTLIPRRVRLYFAVAITVVITPALPPMPAVSPLDLSGLLMIGEQILVGAVLGVGMARGISAIDLGVVGRIFLSWAITIPAGAVLSIIFFYILRAILG